MKSIPKYLFFFFFLVPCSFLLNGGDFSVTGGGKIDGDETVGVEKILRGIEQEFLPRFKLSAQYRLTIFICEDLSQFIRLTGVRWWNGGFFHAGRRTIYLQRLEILKNKGILEQTLAHEYLHFLIWRLAGRNCPVWLNEGLVSNLTGEIRNLDCLEIHSKCSPKELEAMIRSNDRNRTRKGYCLAARKVRDMLKQGKFESIRQLLAQMKK